MTDTLKNLYQRLSAITAEVGSITPTGKTAFKTPAISIADVEDAIRELLAKHGVVTGYSFVEKPEPLTGNLWMVLLDVWLCNADQPDDRRVDRLCDIGNSPSGAVSFALKRYYRALFHLADDDESGPRERKPERVSEAQGGNGAGTGAPSQPPTPSKDVPVEIPGRSALLMQITSIGIQKFGPKTWREEVKKVAQSLVTREFTLVSDLSVEELEEVKAELEQAPQAVRR